MSRRTAPTAHILIDPQQTSKDDVRGGLLPQVAVLLRARSGDGSHTTQTIDANTPSKAKVSAVYSAFAQRGPLTRRRKSPNIHAC